MSKLRKYQTEWVLKIIKWQLAATQTNVNKTNLGEGGGESVTIPVSHQPYVYSVRLGIIVMELQ